MPWNGLVGQHMQGRVCLQSWPLLGPFGRLLADFLRYSYYNRTITVLSYENRTFPYYNRTTTLRTNPVRPHATGPYQPRTTKARFLRNCPLWPWLGTKKGVRFRERTAACCGSGKTPTPPLGFQLRSPKTQEPRGQIYEKRPAGSP